jgi:hypothetical protein
VGYAISVVYADSFPVYSNVVPLEATAGNGSSLQWLRDFLTKDRKGRAVLRSHLLYTCGSASLDQTLDKIVADIDVDVFEPIRKAWAAVPKAKVGQ